jgi:hypothetical protein
VTRNPDTAETNDYGPVRSSHRAPVGVPREHMIVARWAVAHNRRRSTQLRLVGGSRCTKAAAQRSPARRDNPSSAIMNRAIHDRRSTADAYPAMSAPPNGNAGASTLLLVVADRAAVAGSRPSITITAVPSLIASIVRELRGMVLE